MRASLVSVLLAATALGVGVAHAQTIDLTPPPDGEFVLDYANLVSVEDENDINLIAAATLKDMAIPIIIVTVKRMADHGGAGMRIETFATLLYNQWEIGHEKLGDQYWNKGILLVVARDDRYARIELGDGWDRSANDDARRIMDEHIVPLFKRGEYAHGIQRGVKALDAMARGEKLPRAPINMWEVAAVLGGGLLLVFTIVSLIRRGASGWAWLFWAAVFSILGWFLYNALRGSGGAGGFSGGSFGGGFSSGGGATGSW